MSIFYNKTNWEKLYLFATRFQAVNYGRIVTYFLAIQVLSWFVIMSLCIDLLTEKGKRGWRLPSRRLGRNRCQFGKLQWSLRYLFFFFYIWIISSRIFIHYHGMAKKFSQNHGNSRKLHDTDIKNKII